MRRTKKISREEFAAIRSLDELRRMRQRVDLQTMLAEYRLQQNAASFFSAGQLLAHIVQRAESLRMAVAGAIEAFSMIRSLVATWRDAHRARREAAPEREDGPEIPAQ